MKKGSIFEQLEITDDVPKPSSGIEKRRDQVIERLEKQIELFGQDPGMKQRGRGKWFKVSGNNVFLAMYYRNIRLAFGESEGHFIKLTKDNFEPSLKAMIDAVRAGDIDEELELAERLAQKKLAKRKAEKASKED